MTQTREAETLSWLHSLKGDQADRNTSRSPRAAGDSFTSFPFGGSRGGYTGGKADHITGNWRPGEAGPNRLIDQDGDLLRQRAWDLYRNNPFARSAIHGYIANVIESGISPECDDDAWELEWDRWGGLSAHAQRDCDITRDSTINELQRLWLLELLVGGGVLTHYVTMPRRQQRIPLSLELISVERFAKNLSMSGRNPKTSNPIYRGVELDHLTGRTVAFHIYNTLPDDMSFDPLNTTRLSAEHCEYAFVKEKIGAKHGTTLMKAVVIWLWSLGYYADNELKASDLKSSWAYMVKTEHPDDSPLGGLQGRVTDLNGNPVAQHMPGLIWHGGSGDTIQGTGPNVPGADSLPWIEMIERSISIGMDLSYEEVFRDFSKGSFSSVRMSRSGDKKRFRPVQTFTINHLLNPTARRFEEACVGAGIPGFPSPAEYVNSRDEWLAEQEWQTPGWESPNPKDDAAANHQRLLDGTISRQEICAAEGRSYKRTRKRLVREQRDREEDGLQSGATTLDLNAPGDQVPPEEQQHDRGRSTR